MHTQNKYILHIANDYTGSAVYKNLASELDKLEVRQIIYTPFREKNNIGNNEIKFQLDGSKIIYSPILNWHIDRFFYPYKIFKILKDVQSKIDLKKVKCIHAHTWYSDGGVAYFLSKKYNIPFVVTIRNTDINLFQEKLVYLRPLGKKILRHAKQVILISASYKERVLCQSSLRSMKSQLIDKLRVIPNGVDSFWLANSSPKKKSAIDATYNFLYVGKFTAGKQVPALQQAILLLRSELSQEVRLHLVGGGDEDDAKVLELVMKHPNVFTYHGKIHDKQALLTLFQNCDVFTMPSLHETFGLVYVEAMLQGLPILYTEGEGIDGFYSEKIGEKVSVHSIEEIKEKLNLIIDNLDQYSIPLNKIKKNHDWALIAKEYIDIYDASLKQTTTVSDNIL